MRITEIGRTAVGHYSVATALEPGGQCQMTFHFNQCVLGHDGQQPHTLAWIVEKPVQTLTDPVGDI